MHREREEAIPLKSRNRDPSDEDDDDVSGDTTTTRAHPQVPAGDGHSIGHSNGPSGHNDNGYATSMDDDNEVTVEIEVVKPSRLIYKVTDNPPPHMVLLFAVQQSLLSVSTALTVSLLVSELICARSDNEMKTRIMSATFLMIGISTFTMSTVGVRLPVFQGPAMSYIVPLLALTTLPEWQCPAQEDLALHYKNSTMNTTRSMVNGEYLVPRDWINEKIQQLSGSLMAGGVFHMLIGLTGLVGFITRFIGPVTIVPAIVLIGLFIYKVAVRFAETHWGVAALTTGTAVILALYLAKFSTPVPAWNRQRGFHIRWQPLHQMFAILIAVMVGWLVSWLLTELDVLSAEPGNKQFYARTDTRLDIITQAPWFAVPYPGQFGMPSFHVGAFLSFFIATIMSVLDSLGDYSACARACYVPQPPAFAFNRGIAVEGVMSIISGAMGCCHATVSYGGNIGAIGLTKVASRRVFQAIGLLYVLFAVITKVGAVFITIPYCVLGGVQIITSGIFIGVVLSNLQYVDLNSSRNLAIIGMALLLGLMLPYWKEQNPDAIQTGVEDLDRIIGIMISNPVFVGGFVSCFLDNTVPGTLAERGLAKVSPKKKDDDIKQEKNEEISDEFENGYEIYDIPWLPASIKQSAIAKYIPIFPGKSPAKSMTNAPLMAM